MKNKPRQLNATEKYIPRTWKSFGFDYLTGMPKIYLDLNCEVGEILGQLESLKILEDLKAGLEIFATGCIFFINSYQMVECNLC